ncbi:MAG: methylamine utilization protein [Acidobacteria bacterium]|nr:methylamine utilization protein [Acidobacteriota bacterium]
MRRPLAAALALVALLPSRALVANNLTGLALASGRPVADAVIWLDVADGQPPAPSSQADAVLNQRDMQFFPHVLAVRVGTRVKFPNHDRVFHNVFSFHDSRKFDLGLYPVGMVKEVPFDRPGLSRVFCNIHPQMAAYVMVLETAYYAVSDRGGRFVIPNLPAAPTRYHAWRPGGPVLNGEFDPSSGAPLEVSWP